MAGDWIKIENVTPDKPEVMQMAEFLQIEPNTVMGGLVRFWAWADQHSVDGNALSVTRASIDRLSGVTKLSQALDAVGWLKEIDGKFMIPNFDRHNGNTAKERALTAKRQAKFRQIHRNAYITPVTSPREEKRRVTTISNKKGEFTRPNAESVTAYALSIGFGLNGQQFCDYYDSNGWKVGKSPMKDWQAAVRTWKTRHTTDTLPKGLAALQRADAHMRGAQ